MIACRHLHLMLVLVPMLCATGCYRLMSNDSGAQATFRAPRAV